MEKHTIKPFYKEDSKVLILGSFPSVKSRADGFYYAHLRNRFWQVLGKLFNEELNNIEMKKDFLKKYKIALYDVVEQCEIKGSADASMKKIIPTNIKEIIDNSNIALIILNGSTATKYYQKFFSDLKIKTISLPSTSPANAKFHLEDLIQEYQIILSYLR